MLQTLNSPSATKSGKNPPARIQLLFADTQGPIERARLSYAFSLFCAVYGHQLASGHDSDICLTYSSALPAAGKPAVRLSALYRQRPLDQPAPPPTQFAREGRTTVLFYPPGTNAEPDWLGEIFEWVSCADEYSLPPTERPSATSEGKQYVFRHGLDPYVPYAAAAMRFLQDAIRKVEPGCSELPPPLGDGQRHHVIVTHDVDYLPQTRSDTVARIAKNAAAALLAHKRPVLAMQLAAKAIAAALSGGNPLDQIRGLAGGEQSRNIQAVYFFIPRRAHRRDGNYDISSASAAGVMRALEENGMEIGVHGSYLSLTDPPTLAQEFETLRRTGCEPAGNRQHWLRFRLEKLIPELEAAGASYDSSLGWSDSLGFRAGACFPFPPYYFAEERPANFIEIPLVAMDVALIFGRSSIPSSRWHSVVSQVLGYSRQFGFGGVAILWHPTGFGGGQVPGAIGDLFWRLADERAQCGENWTSGVDFLRVLRSRYEPLGLMPSRQ